MSRERDKLRERWDAYCARPASWSGYEFAKLERDRAWNEALESACLSVVVYGKYVGRDFKALLASIREQKRPQPESKDAEGIRTMNERPEGSAPAPYPATYSDEQAADRAREHGGPRGGSPKLGN